MKRRAFLSAGVGMAAALPAVVHTSTRAAAFPRPTKPKRVRDADPVPEQTLRDPRMHELAYAALEAARSAGARYADVRMTQSLRRSVSDDTDPSQTVQLGLSVRALVEGYWGWAATPVLSADEAVRVARRATEFALKSSLRIPGANVELDTSPVVTAGDWSTPVKIDPFTLDLVDVQDWLYGMSRHLYDVCVARGVRASVAWQQSTDAWYVILGVGFVKQERLFASTEGTFLTQTVILTTPSLNFPYKNGLLLVPSPAFNTPAQAGWERIAEMPLVALMEQAMDRADAEPLPPPPKPVEIGRYDVVFGANAMAQILNATLAPATHLDSATGYEAYTGNVSYLGPDPLKHLGRQLTSPLVSVTAERSNPAGMATVKWDDEGVAPRDFPLVTNGMLANYQTTRAHAAWLAPWYTKHGQPVQSLGCAMAPSALDPTMQHTPNLVLHPGANSATEASLVAELEHGYYIPAIAAPGPPGPNGPGVFRAIGMDWQYKQGFITPVIGTEIRHGKPVSATPLSNLMAIMFTTEELWKNVQALGGPQSLVYAGGFASYKGDPNQTTLHSVGAVPARVKQLAVVDTARMT